MHTQKTQINTKLKIIICKPRNSQVKGKTQTKPMRQKKKNLQIPLSLFWLGHLLLGVRRDLDCGLSEILKEPNFSLWVIISSTWLLGSGFEIMSSSPCQCWELIWHEPVRARHMHATTVSMSSYVLALLCLENLSSLTSLILTDSYHLSAFPSSELSEPRGEKFDRNITFSTEGSKVSPLFSPSSPPSLFTLSSCVFVLISCSRKLLQWWLSKMLICFPGQLRHQVSTWRVPPDIKDVEEES